ncbi:MAG: hypothetical protein EXX96DRAFT_391608 [Benjaminiella poitrasii]|nr:MAG: hypothetical protein EXX96DRAFT_391608 [Benjaminiella poitrasii]
MQEILIICCMRNSCITRPNRYGSSKRVKEEYLKSSNEAFEYVEANLMTSPLDQLSLTIDIFKLRVRIHEYFDHQLQLESCKKLLSETIKEEKLLRQKLENNYLMNTMDIIPEYTRITPSIHKAFKMKIQVKVVFSSNMEAIEFKAQYERAPETVQRLLDDIATRCWIQHGIEPVLSHLRTMDHDLFPEDYLRNIITQENQPIEAYAKDIVIKQPLQIYLNACDRLKVEPVKEIKLRLTKQSSNKISFTGLNLSIQQLAPLQQVIHHSTTLQTLKLSTNMLCKKGRFFFFGTYYNITHILFFFISIGDEDLKLLLEGANYDRLGELVLSNNRLTSVHLLIQPFRLRSIDLSHNPIGPSFLKHLPTFLIAVPSLKLINLENTHIGHHTVIEPETQQAYEQFESHKMSAASLSIDISSNHFENDMLIQWTTLWRKLKRLSRLDMASVTSDFGWKNFDSLSDLSTLSDLGFKYSIRETLNYCRFHEFFRLKGQLNQLDLTACGLTLDGNDSHIRRKLLTVGSEWIRYLKIANIIACMLLFRYGHARL